MSIDPHLSTNQTAAELSVDITGKNGQYSNIKPASRTGDLSVHRPAIQGNSNTFKITQVGPVIGSNLVVSRMDRGDTSSSSSNNTNLNLPRPTSASPIPIAGPLAPTNTLNSSVNHVNSNYYFNNQSNTTTNSTSTRRNTVSNPANFYHNTANNVTKFTNMTVGNVGAKNPLKPNHYTVPNVPVTAGSNNPSNISTHPNSSLSAPNTSGIAPKSTLKASDLIHILPNLFNTLKRRNSNSGASGGARSTAGSNGYFNGNGASGNSLAAAVAAAASNSGKPMTTSSAAAFVAEQLLNVAASGPFSDDSSSSPPPQSTQNSQQQYQNSTYTKRIKLTGSALQCEICGKVYKHRNCLSKHMWEHHESWEHTKKVCQTKHQQVQLLEAAQVLSEIISGKVSSGSSQKGNYSESEDDDEDDGEVVDGSTPNSVDESYENISIGDLE